MPLASLFGSHPCERHGLPECVLAHTDALEGKTDSRTKNQQKFGRVRSSHFSLQEFYRQLQGVEGNVTSLLASHAVSFPSTSFGSVFPKDAAQAVTTAEAAAAFGYVSSPSLAKQINRLQGSGVGSNLPVFGAVRNFPSRSIDLSAF
eukprot:Skav232813  [mRNA]  locus=scaffold614:550095:551297:- [translate_table: standard]